jgi:hypothetical protein
VRWEKTTFQIVLRFVDEEAAIVRAAVGDKPAEQILAWAREEVTNAVA